MDRFLAHKICVLLFGGIAVAAGAQDNDSTATVLTDDDVYLECTSDTGRYLTLTIAINAQRKRASARVHVDPERHSIAIVVFEEDHIRLDQRGGVGRPPYVRIYIDRRTLMLERRRFVVPYDGQQEIIDTGECKIVPPEPDLMP